MRKSQQELPDEFNRSGFDFLMIDLDTAIEFTRRALQSSIQEVKRRNITNARKAYDSVVRLREKIELDSEQQLAFDKRRMTLKNALLKSGERLDVEFGGY